jgi:hypothetical protein
MRDGWEGMGALEIRLSFLLRSSLSWDGFEESSFGLALLEGIEEGMMLLSLSARLCLILSLLLLLDDGESRLRYRKSQNRERTEIVLIPLIKSFSGFTASEFQRD